jgi:nicotinate-nucleotide pyrophosphorylase (carboxylating)
MSQPIDPGELIALWFKEDIGEGDHTSLSTIPESKTGSASLLVKEQGILAGVEVSREVFARFDPLLEASYHLQDGASIAPGDVAFHLVGPVRSILQVERLILNIMQRMSGIATRTRQFTNLIEGTGARILDTRKTTPGFRIFEKEAVRIGGGLNHRFGLYDMIMIKDNHIDFAGGIPQAISSANLYLEEKGLRLDIEVETRSLKDVQTVLETGHVRRILLDNFSVEDTREAVRIIGGRYETESSGGINEETIRAYAECGVDYISIGSLTHHIRSLDLSLKADF